eukprot:Em0001g3545a
MAPGLKVGDLVKAKAVNVLGNRRAGDVFGPWAAKSELHGSVIECVAVGRMRKLKVEWNECDDISILSARSLELDDLCTSVEAVEESTDSESSIDEEAGDSMDYSEGRQCDLEEPGVSQLRPHGTEWLVEMEGIQIDYYDGAKRNLDFIWTFDNPVEQRSPLEYFCAMFPMVEAAFWIEKTNARLAEMKRKPLSKCEYFRFWGLILAFSISSEKNRRNYWMEELDGESGRIFLPPAFGTRFGMGIRRFEDILRCLSFGDEDCNDPWSPIRPFMDALNNRRQQVINPSHMIVEDELMSSWISRKQDRTADGIPHRTKIIRKPKGVGTEIKCVADGLVVCIEICEGKEAESKKKWSHLPAGTAQTLRLSEPWHGTGRIIVADSAFSSVTTAIELKKCGLLFTGVVKTASREFPKEYLNDACTYRHEGDHICLTTIIDNCNLIALGWKDKTIKSFVSTCGTTQPGEPHKKHRYSKEGDIITTEIPRPQLVSQYFSASSKIDVHNHLRQGLLNIEDAWGTQTWWHRLAATFVGITVIDAMLAYNYERRVDAKSVEDFANDLALSLIFNKFDGYELVSRRRLSDEPIAAEPPIPAVPFEAHPLKSLLTLPKYKKNIGSKKGARRFVQPRGNDTMLTTSV